MEFTALKLDGVVEAAHRLQNSREFIVWLPENRSMQLELIDKHKRRLQRARGLLLILNNNE